MINELERIWKEGVLAESGYYADILLEGLKKNTRNHIQDRWYPD
jgi:hypothetical protein